jgi:transposase
MSLNWSSEEGICTVLFVGDDWAEAHHDVELQNGDGTVAVRRRLPEGIAGISQLHGLIADHLSESDEPAGVLIGIETDRGPWVQALLAAGYTVYPINPLQVARYRERHGVAGGKSDAGDAHVLAEIVRLDRSHHRPAAGDSELAEQLRVTARAHQSMIWTRQRSTNTLRSLLREFYPAALQAFGEDLAGRDALAVLAAAPSPEQGRRLTAARVAALLDKAGRQRNLKRRAAEIVATLRTEQLPARPGVVPGYAASVSALVAVITEMVRQTAVLEEQVRQGFGQHPDVDIYLSQPGLGMVLGARVLAEFGDDPGRYPDPRARKNYAGMAPITKASGTKRFILARHVRNRRLADALYQQALSALRSSPGARAYYDRLRARGATHHQALRALANRLVGILHGCLTHHMVYDETIAWTDQHQLAA